MNHFTDRAGFNGIRSTPTWVFRAQQPPPRHHPAGAYFTDYEETEPNLAKKLFIPREKLAFVFRFHPAGPLEPLPGGRGRMRRIWFSRIDYEVPESHQIHHGETGLS